MGWGFVGGMAGAIADKRKQRMAEELRAEADRKQKEFQKMMFEMGRAERTDARIAAQSMDELKMTQGRFDRNAEIARLDEQRKEDIAREDARNEVLDKRANEQQALYRQSLGLRAGDDGLGLRPQDILKMADYRISELSNPGQRVKPGQQGVTREELVYDVAPVDPALLGRLRQMRADLAAELIKPVKMQDKEKIAVLTQMIASSGAGDSMSSGNPSGLFTGSRMEQ